jgi:hypothetical protein
MKINYIHQRVLAFFITLVFALPVIGEEMNDVRTLVKLPSDIERKMLFNMRDHIRALDDIIHAVQSGEYEDAENIAESRLGWSSLVRQGDQEVADHWPEPMQAMANQMYDAGSNFVIVAQNASVEDSKESHKKVIAALGQMTSACRGCHEAYRLR